jgi:hypothetical protein
MAKINLDQQLIASARRITTGANIHHIKQLVFVYEQAVSLHNCGWPTHEVYQSEHENALRQFVAKELQLGRSSKNRSGVRAGRAEDSPPCKGGVDATSRKFCDATLVGADGVVSSTTD